MEVEKKPTQMIIDQIKLLISEEKKLKKFVDKNENARKIISEHLNEIKNKKKRLYQLCDLMGLSEEELEEITSLKEGHESRNYKIPQPTGRFGSALINTTVDKI